MFNVVYFRIIKQDKKLTAQEIEEKMNLDETLCCPHRTKRKRRRRESNSEDDETYSPKVNGVPTNVKHKPVKKYRSLTHRTGGRYGMNAIQPTYKPPIPIRPRPNLGLLPSGQSLQADPLKSVSHEKSATKSESIVVPSPGVIKPNTTLSSRFDSNTLQQQSTLYHTSFMNTSGSTAYIQTPVTVSSATRIILPPQSQPQLTSYPFQQPSSYQSQQTSSYQSQQASPYQPQVNSYQPRQANSYQPQTSSYQPSLQSSPNTMVSIPNTLEQHRSLFLLPKPKESNITLTPNIIELDSDSDDEPRVVVQQNNMTTDEGSMDISSISNISSSKIVPVALTWENNDDEIMREEQPLREMRATVAKDVSFNEVMLPHTRELDRLLSDTKEKMYNLFDLNSAIENIEVKAQQKMEHFYCNMRDAVIQLVHINDRVVRQYTEWRRSRKTEASSSINENALVSQENMNIPLDMICVNDSDTEFEYQAQVMKPSDLVKDSNIIKDLLFRKTNVVHRGVGDDRVQLSADKAIQVYDTVSIDYEKSISCSIFTKTNQDSKTDDNISNLPATSDKKFSKYEEQFLFYLQHIEDTDKILNVKTKKGTNAANSDDTSVQEVIQTNPSFISHLFQDIDLPVISTDQSKNCQENNLNDSINSITKDDKNDILDKNNKGTVNNSDVKTNMQLNNKLQQMDSQKIQANMMNRETVISYNEVNSSKNDNIINMEVVAFSGSEEDCTIIDD